MEAVRAQNVTVLFVEHDMDIVTRYTQRMLAFYEGRIIADGVPAKVLEDPEVRKYVTGEAAHRPEDIMLRIERTRRLDPGRRHPARRQHGRADGQIRRPHRPQRRRQDHADAAHHGHPAGTPGQYRFDGSPLGKTPAHQRARNGIGYMPEDRRLVPPLTVEENVLIPAWSAGVADPRATARRRLQDDPRSRSIRRAQGVATFRRPTETRGAGARADVRHQAAVARRTLRRRCARYWQNGWRTSFRG